MGSQLHLPQPQQNKAIGVADCDPSLSPKPTHIELFVDKRKFYPTHLHAPLWRENSRPVCEKSAIVDRQLHGIAVV